MIAALHLMALLVSIPCLAFSIRGALAGRWWKAVGDAVMVAAMVATLVLPLGSVTLLTGGTLILLALIEALIARLSPPHASGHGHRAICLLVMGAVTIAMTHTDASSQTGHVHSVPFVWLGAVGLVTVGLLAVSIRRRMSFSAAGMLVATGLMSVATVAA